jgi:hypothetical protein
VPPEMKEGTIPIWGTKGLSTRPRCITLITHSIQSLVFFFEVKNLRKILLRNGGFVIIWAETEQFGVAVKLRL